VILCIAVKRDEGCQWFQRRPATHYDLPARGKSHPITFWYGSRRNLWSGSLRLRWNSFCSVAFLANATTCSSVCRLSFGSAIHSRMIFRRVSWSSIFAAPWLILSGIAGRVRERPVVRLCRTWRWPRRRGTPPHIFQGRGSVAIPQGPWSGPASKSRSNIVSRQRLPVRFRLRGSLGATETLVAKSRHSVFCLSPHSLHV